MYGPYTHCKARSAKESEATEDTFFVKGVAPRGVSLLAEMQQKSYNKGPDCDNRGCSLRRKQRIGNGSGACEACSSTREDSVRCLTSRRRQTEIAVGRPVHSRSVGFGMYFLLPFATVLLRVAQTLPERAHGLVDKGGKRGAVVALEAGVVQVVVLVALEVVFVAAVAGGRAECQMHKKPQKHERRRWNKECR